MNKSCRKTQRRSELYKIDIVWEEIVLPLDFGQESRVLVGRCRRATGVVLVIPLLANDA